MLGCRSSEFACDEEVGVSLLTETARIDGLRVSLGYELGSEHTAGDAHDSCRLRDSLAQTVVLLVAGDASGVDRIQGSLSAKQQLDGLVWLGPDDVSSLDAGGSDLHELIALKTYLRHGLGYQIAETSFSPQRQLRYIRALDKSREYAAGFAISSDVPNDLVRHPYVDRATDALVDGRSVVLIGQSSSGKTSLSRQISRAISLRGMPSQRHSLGDATLLPVDAIEPILFQPPSRGVVLIDDAQSSPAGARLLLTLLNLNRRCRDDSILSGLICSWPEFSREVLELAEGCLPLTVRAEQIAGRIVTDRAPDETRGKEALDLFASDLSLLCLALDMLADQDELLLSSMAESIASTPGFNALGHQGLERVLYVVACLGRYDIGCPPDFLSTEASVNADVLDTLLDAKLLRREGDLLRLGHRSRCSLLVAWLEMHWHEEVKSPFDGGSTGVLVDYLQAVGPATALTTLRFLESLLGFRDPDALGGRSSALVGVWQTFLSLLDNVRRQQSVDPTWGATPSSCMYAVEILSEVGARDEAAPTIAFLRSHLETKGAQLVVDLDHLATREDFIQIRSRMQEDDNNRKKRDLQPYETPATQIDPEEMHRSWLLGVILSAEAIYEPGSPLSVALVDEIGRKQGRDGAFYPARVPWVTCRVMLGLSRHGLTVHNSEVVAAAAEWLQKPTSGGGARSGDHWESGTGTWNSSVEATAMALLALDSVGVNVDSAPLQGCLNWLLETRRSWVETGRELDGALALHTAVAAGSRWDDLASEAVQLSTWARAEALWEKATISADEMLDQSCRVAQIAADLVSIGWSAVRTDVPVLVESLALPRQYRDRLAAESIKGHVPRRELQPAPSGQISVEEDAVETALDKMSHVSLEECTVVGAYRRYDERARNQLRRLVDEISAPLEHPSGRRANHLIWASPGSGKTFLIQQIAATQSGISYIELNLARDPEVAFRNLAGRLSEESGPILVLIDEVDARSEENWPYETFFSLLDLNLQSERRVCFVLIGSKPGGLNSLVAGMRSRNKGEDLVTRIPEHNRCSLPPLEIEDRIVVTISAVLDAAARQGRTIREVEKLALYYPLSQESFDSLRQLGELAETALSRVPDARQQICYDDLFERGDFRNQRFYKVHYDIAERLADRYISVRTEA
jgi:DNA replication protein DnaC